MPITKFSSAMREGGDNDEFSAWAISQERLRFARECSAMWHTSIKRERKTPLVCGEEKKCVRCYCIMCLSFFSSPSCGCAFDIRRRKYREPSIFLRSYVVRTRKKQFLLATKKGFSYIRMFSWVRVTGEHFSSHGRWRWWSLWEGIILFYIYFSSRVRTALVKGKQCFRSAFEDEQRKHSSLERCCGHRTHTMQLPSIRSPGIGNSLIVQLRLSVTERRQFMRLKRLGGKKQKKGFVRSQCANWRLRHKKTGTLPHTPTKRYI